MDNLAFQALSATFRKNVEPAALQQALFDALLSLSLRLTGANEGGVLSIAENRNSIRIETWEGKGVDLKSRILPLTTPPSSISARCAQSGHAERIPDVSKESLFVARSDSPIKSQLTVPICHQGAVIGLINLESTRPAYFSEKHLASMLEMAEEIAPFWRLVADSARAARQLNLLRSLTAVSESLLEDTERAGHETLELVLNEALRLTDSDLGGVCLLSAEKDALIVFPAKGLKTQDKEFPRIPKGCGFTWRCILDRKPINVSDVNEHRGVYHDLSEGEIRSLLCVPMATQTEVIGVLNLESKDLNHFSLQDEENLTAFANQAAIAVSLLRLRQRFAAADALAALGSLSGNLTHTINNSVGAIRVLSKMLSRKLEAASPESLGIVDEIHNAATEALGVVQQYGQMFSSDEKPIDTTSLLKKVVAEARTPDEISVLLDLADPTPIIQASHNSFSEIIRELLRNAIKALGPVGEIRIKSWQEEFHVFISVSDNGMPISEDIAAKMFDRGYAARLNNRGTGFGLWWIRSYMCKIGGDIRYVAGEPAGNTFKLLFPRTDQPENHHHA